jgi:hypothetical protein
LHSQFYKHGDYATAALTGSRLPLMRLQIHVNGARACNRSSGTREQHSTNKPTQLSSIGINSLFD